MPNKEMEYRHATLKDDKLITHCSVIKDHFVTHQAHFNGFNNIVFHETYHEVIQGKITLAQDTMSDAFILKRQATHTSKLEEQKSTIVRELSGIEVIVKRGFHDNQAVINEFRLNKIHEAAKNIDTLTGFSKDVVVMIKNYQAELTVEGFDITKTEAFQNSITELDTLRRNQMEAIHTRPIHTKDRIQKMNVLWQQLCELKDVSEIIFANEPELKALFALPRSAVRQEDSVEDESDTTNSETIIAE